MTLKKVDNDPIRLLQMMKYGAQVARKGSKWVVVVCPDEVHGNCNDIMASMAMEGLPSSGRTLSFPEGGKLTLVGESSKFQTEDPFYVLFVGWNNGKSKEVMHKWRERATGVVQRSL